MATLVPNRARSPRCSRVAAFLWAAAALPACADAVPAGAEQVSATPGKGPAHELSLPAPGEQDGTWRYVAPEPHGSLYDASYFDGSYYVLHGTIANSEKVVLSEVNWLSWTRDGMSWQTVTLTEQPYQSYTKLASNGKSLLLAGVHHVSKLEGEQAVPIKDLDQSVYPPVMLPYPDGYAIARFDDVVWLDNEGKVSVVLQQQLAQFRAGVARTPPERSFATGPFATYASSTGKDWSAVDITACLGCKLAYGNGRYVAASTESVFVSSTGATWEEHPFTEPDAGPQAERITDLDFTGQHFVALLSDSDMRLSRDGSTWSNPLGIRLDQVGPAPCAGRCVVAAGRLLLPPVEP